ncbi:MAG: TIGR03915 family putative DNA repair protein [Clostridia bacterium]
MDILLFDGSFEGLLTVIYAACKARQPVLIRDAHAFQPSMFGRPQTVLTDTSLSGKMEEHILGKAGSECMAVMYKAFLSEDPWIYDPMLSFFKKMQTFGSEVLFMHSDDDVRRVLDAQKKVSRESHRMIGLLRFRKIHHEMLYACCTPTSNVLPVIAPHFTDRMRNENWAIHDSRRNTYAFYNKQECVLGFFPDAPAMGFQDIDVDYENLWKAYFRHISIRERENRKLQVNHMPVKYWIHLTEKQ